MSNPFRLQNLVAPPYQPDRGEAVIGAIDKISGALEKRRAREEEQRRWELERQRLLGKDAQYTRQNDLNEQRMAAGEARALQEHELKLSDRNQKQFQSLRELAGQGRESEAEAFAASSKYVDPKTGQSRSLGYTRSDPGDPGVDAKDFAGFMETMPMWGPQGATGGAVSEKPDYSGFTGMFGARERQNAKITTPDGEATEIDPSEGDAWKQREAEAAAQRNMEAAARETDPRMRAVFLREAEMARARMPNAAAQAVRNVETQEDSQAFQGEQGDKNREVALKRRRSAVGDGSGDGGIDVRTVLDANGNPVGLAPGNRKSSPEGVRSREMYAQLEPIKSGLGRMRDTVGQTDWTDRVPFFGGKTDRQQKIKGQLDTLLAPLSQFLGSGTPQDREAARKIETMSVSIAQNPDTAQANIDELLQYVGEAYDARVRSLVPGAKSATPAPAPGSRPGGVKPTPKKFVEVNGKLMVEE